MNYSNHKSQAFLALNQVANSKINDEEGANIIEKIESDIGWSLTQELLIEILVNSEYKTAREVILQLWYNRNKIEKKPQTIASLYFAFPGGSNDSRLDSEYGNTWWSLVCFLTNTPYMGSYNPRLDPVISTFIDQLVAKRLSSSQERD